MDYSLNEIETQAIKAARGAGLAWGIAEEAGKATSWLSAHGMDGARLLASCLVRALGKDYEDLKTVVDDGPWHGAEGELCPILAGIALCDRADRLGAGNTIELVNVTEPAMLLPFAARISTALDKPVQLRGPNCAPVLDRGTWLSPDGALPAITSLAAAITVSVLDQCPDYRPVMRADGAVRVRDALWTELDLLARRTYVPESEASRAHGAGAGDIDND